MNNIIRMKRRHITSAVEKVEKDRRSKRDRQDLPVRVGGINKTILCFSLVVQKFYQQSQIIARQWSPETISKTGRVRKAR